MNGGLEMPKFPEVAWFQALADAMGERQDYYRRLGFAEINLVLEMLDPPGGGPLRIGLHFEDYECTAVEAIDGDPFAAFGADCVVRGPYRVWAEMVDAILEHGHADPRHTLNSLVMLHTPLDVDGPDQYGVDKFFRYQGTLQAFFDEAGRLGRETIGAAVTP